jgi:hypothetical protein
MIIEFDTIPTVIIALKAILKRLQAERRICDSVSDTDNKDKTERLKQDYDKSISEFEKLIKDYKP